MKNNPSSKNEESFYQKMGIPMPSLSPQERHLRRLLHRNFTNIYFRKCSATGNRMMSMYDSDMPFPVYSNDYWWSDNWDVKKYFSEYDFNKNFFAQYQELKNKVPHYATFNIQSENCDYTVACMNSKNCYLVFGCVKNNDCMYGHIIWESENCVDCLYIFQSQWCSNSIDIVGCYDLHFSKESTNCRESMFLYDCRNCTNCFGCTNMRSKQYCLFNKQLNKESYQKELAKLVPLTRESIARYNKWLEQQDVATPACFESQSEEVTGNHLYFCKNCDYCFDLKRCEDSKYCFTALDLSSCYDLSFTGLPNRFCCDSLSIGNCENTVFSHFLVQCSNAAYSEFCFNSQDIFGCNGLRNAKYCILNKQYSKSEYLALKEKIIKHMGRDWGEFFPNSPFCYNESTANEYFPLSKEEALSLGYRWKDQSKVAGISDETNSIPDSKVPSSIVEVKDQILSQVFRCSKTHKNYRYTKAELEFYRRMKLPLPQGSFIARHQERMEQRQRRVIYAGECSGCKAKIQHAPGRNVMCRECYERVVL